MDATIVALKKMYDVYGICAGRFVAVLRCIQEGDCGN